MHFKNFSLNINTDIRGERRKGGGFFKIPQSSHPAPVYLQNTISHFLSRSIIDSDNLKCNAQ